MNNRHQPHGIFNTSQKLKDPPRFIEWTDGKFATRCEDCGGRSHVGGSPGYPTEPCQVCNGSGYFGINPNEPTTHLPGTFEKSVMLGARYGAGLPMWNKRDAVEMPKFVTFGDNQDDEEDGPWT